MTKAGYRFYFTNIVQIQAGGVSRHPGYPEGNLVRDGGVWGALGAITFPGSP